MRTKDYLTFIFSLFLGITFVSCGGGGGGGGGESTSPIVSSQAPAIEQEASPILTASLPATTYSQKDAQKGLELTFNISNDTSTKIYFTQGNNAVASPTEDSKFLYQGESISISADTVFKFLIVPSKGKKIETSLSYSFDLTP